MPPAETVWRTWKTPPQKVADWVSPPGRALTTSIRPFVESMTEPTGTGVESSRVVKVDVPGRRTRMTPATVSATTRRPTVGVGSAPGVAGAAGVVTVRSGP